MVNPTELWRQLQDGQFEHKRVIGEAPYQISRFAPQVSFSDFGQLSIDIQLEEKWGEILDPEHTEYFVELLQKHVNAGLQVENNSVYLEQEDGSFELLATLPKLHIPPPDPRRMNMGDVDEIVVLPGTGAGKTRLSPKKKEEPEPVSNQTLVLNTGSSTLTSSEDMTSKLERSLQIAQCYLMAMGQQASSEEDQTPYQKVILRPLPEKRFGEQESEHQWVRDILDDFEGIDREVLQRAVEVSDLPDKTFDDIKGQQRLKEELELVAAQLKNPEHFRAIGAEPPGGILLYGEPGCGKSLGAKALANKLGYGFLSGDLAALLQGGRDKLERNLRGLTAVGANLASRHESNRAIVFLDEVDRLVGLGESIEGILRTSMSGVGDESSIVWICATNHPEKLSRALLNRMDLKISVPPPDEEGCKEIFMHHFSLVEEKLGRKLIEPEAFTPEVTQELRGASGRTLEKLVNRTLVLKGKDSLASDSPKSDDWTVTEKDIIRASQTSDWKSEERLLKEHKPVDTEVESESDDD